MMDFSQAPNDVCRMSYASSVTDSMSSFNQALAQASCVQIYDSATSSDNMLSSVDNLLQNSLPCSLNDPIGVCPNPGGAEAHQEQARYSEVSGLSIFSAAERRHRERMTAVALLFLGVFAFMLACAIVFVERTCCNRRRYRGAHRRSMKKMLVSLRKSRSRSRSLSRRKLEETESLPTQRSGKFSFFASGSGLDAKEEERRARKEKRRRERSRRRRERKDRVGIDEPR